MLQTGNYEARNYEQFDFFNAEHAATHATGHSYVVNAADQECDAQRWGEYVQRLLRDVRLGRTHVYSDDIFAYIADIGRLAARSAQTALRLRQLAKTAPVRPIVPLVMPAVRPTPLTLTP